MAGTTVKVRQMETGGSNHETTVSLNKAINDLDALRAAFVALTAKLDADAGVTDTNYASTLNPAAITGNKVANDQGTIIA